jgi:SAM-dependent methyltransferase
MNRALEQIPWPPLPGGEVPRWDGECFQVAGRREAVLSYGQAQSHWSPELTSLHEAEAGAEHPIDVASRRLAMRSIRRHISQSTPVVLDVGCSSGFFVEALLRGWADAAVIGADFIRAPLLKLAQRVPRVPLLLFDLRNCPLPGASVDVVVALNVLEHIDEDERALRQIHRILKPEGLAYIEVPAGPHLHDLYDEVLQHHRRYRLAGLLGMAREAGFEPLAATHLGAFLYPAFWWTKRRNQRLGPLAEEAKRQWVARQIRTTAHSGLMRAVLALELALGRWVRYPLGIRCVVLLRKPGTAP